jgi:hypothetical protein
MLGVVHRQRGYFRQDVPSSGCWLYVRFGVHDVLADKGACCMGSPLSWLDDQLHLVPVLHSVELPCLPEFVDLLRKQQLIVSCRTANCFLRIKVYDKTIKLGIEVGNIGAAFAASLKVISLSYIPWPLFLKNQSEQVRLMLLAQMWHIFKLCHAAIIALLPDFQRFQEADLR